MEGQNNVTEARVFGISMPDEEMESGLSPHRKHAIVRMNRPVSQIL